jgi:hypothetical protein
MAADWSFIEPGWYTSDLGGIARERSGQWFFYPRFADDRADGPFASLAIAKQAAETAQQQEGEG